MSSITMAADSTQVDRRSRGKSSRSRSDKKRKRETSRERRRRGHRSKSSRSKERERGWARARGGAASRKSGDDESSENESDLDLTEELLPISSYVKNPEEMVTQMFRSISAKKLKAMLPPILKNIGVEELKGLCLAQLEGMSKMRVCKLLEGVNADEISSSGTEDEDEEMDTKDDSGSLEPVTVDSTSAAPDGTADKEQEQDSPPLDGSTGSQADPKSDQNSSNPAMETSTVNPEYCDEMEVSVKLRKPVERAYRQNKNKEEERDEGEASSDTSDEEEERVIEIKRVRGRRERGMTLEEIKAQERTRDKNKEYDSDDTTPSSLPSLISEQEITTVSISRVRSVGSLAVHKDDHTSDADVDPADSANQTKDQEQKEGQEKDNSAQMDDQDLKDDQKGSSDILISADGPEKDCENREVQKSCDIPNDDSDPMKDMDAEDCSNENITASDIGLNVTEKESEESAISSDDKSDDDDNDEEMIKSDDNVTMTRSCDSKAMGNDSEIVKSDCKNTDPVLKSKETEESNIACEDERVVVPVTSAKVSSYDEKSDSETRNVDLSENNSKKDDGDDDENNKSDLASESVKDKDFSSSEEMEQDTKELSTAAENTENVDIPQVKVAENISEDLSQDSTKKSSVMDTSSDNMEMILEVQEQEHDFSDEEMLIEKQETERKSPSKNEKEEQEKEETVSKTNQETGKTKTDKEKKTKTSQGTKRKSEVIEGELKITFSGAKERKRSERIIMEDDDDDDDDDEGSQIKIRKVDKKSSKKRSRKGSCDETSKHDEGEGQQKSDKKNKHKTEKSLKSQTSEEGKVVEKDEPVKDKEESKLEKSNSLSEKGKSPREKEKSPTEKDKSRTDKDNSSKEKEKSPTEQEKSPREKEKSRTEKEKSPTEKVKSPREKEREKSKDTDEHVKPSGSGKSKPKTDSKSTTEEPVSKSRTSESESESTTSANTASKVAEQSGSKSEGGLSKTQLEILELEMRARAIKAMLKAQEELEKHEKKTTADVDASRRAVAIRLSRTGEEILPRTSRMGEEEKGGKSADKRKSSEAAGVVDSRMEGEEKVGRSADKRKSSSESGRSPGSAGRSPGVQSPVKGSETKRNVIARDSPSSSSSDKARIAEDSRVSPAQDCGDMGSGKRHVVLKSEQSREDVEPLRGVLPSGSTRRVVASSGGLTVVQVSVEADKQAVGVGSGAVSQTKVTPKRDMGPRATDGRNVRSTGRSKRGPAPVISRVGSSGEGDTRTVASSRASYRYS